MCGLTGFVGNKDSKVNVDLFREIMLATEKARGGHAFGMAWLDGNGVLRMHKEAGKLRDKPHAVNLIAGASMVIGHLRYATKGAAWAWSNAHPHPSNGGWLCHNGTVPLHRQLAEYRGMVTNGHCDIEVLAGLVEVAPRRDMAQRLAWAVNVARQGSPQAALGLWSRPGRLLAAVAGKPLAWSSGPEGTYLASLGRHLPGKAHELPCGSVWTFRVGQSPRLSVKQNWSGAEQREGFFPF